jgi:hypothetical protein
MNFGEPDTGEVRRNPLPKLSEKGAREAPGVDWAVYGGQNGPRSTVSVARKASLQAPPRLFGQSLQGLG